MRSKGRQTFDIFETLSTIIEGIFFVDFKLQNLFSASFIRKFKPFFQNFQNEIWPFLGYFKNLILKPNISKIFLWDYEQSIFFE